MGKKKRKTSKTDEVVISCAICGHRHIYESLHILDQIPTTTPCKNCGFLFLQHISNKMKATQVLLESDSKAMDLLKAGDIKGFKDYFEQKTGLF